MRKCGLLRITLQSGQCTQTVQCLRAVACKSKWYEDPRNLTSPWPTDDIYVEICHIPYSLLD